ncbi:hypothetical protein SAMN05216456_3194 [Devosia crocina]|uniref:Lysine-specific metallo-endopeptidase n=1 Tax=Devosia crocina TaxID=429728 RepID=A0A1I7NTP8_9HYPH|nr:hypothetical protein [Devosia crocina]SFV37968.1 hypothetical protein SAMN05216456_3194 [Devosia crocina]
MRIALAVFLCLAVNLVPARAGSVDTAFSGAIGQFEAAFPHLPAELFGVDTATYRDALTLRRFASAHWGSPVALRVEEGTAANPSCARFAAFVRLPPQSGEVSLVLCPQFHTPGADALRTLTVLHELVHVVAGPDECRAMAFAAQVEHLATGQFTDVARYWNANGCGRSGFALP